MKASVGRSAYSAQHALVEVAELLSAHGGRAALDSGDFDVLAVAKILVERHWTGPRKIKLFLAKLLNLLGLAEIDLRASW
jgi:hypothetical protein